MKVKIDVHLDVDEIDQWLSDNTSTLTIPETDRVDGYLNDVLNAVMATAKYSYIVEED